MPSLEEFWASLIYRITFELVSFGLTPLNPESFLYWPFVLSFLGISLLVFIYLAWRSQTGFWLTVKQVLTKRIWWSASSKADYRYFIINGLLFPLIVGPVLIGGAELGSGITAMLTSLFGAVESRPPSDTGRVLLLLSYTLVFFLLHDFGRYLAHWAQHKYSWLWQFHKVHHSAEVLTPITSFRAHPVDLLLMSLGASLFTGIALGIYDWLWHGYFGYWVFLGNHVLIAIYKLFGNLRHSHVWLSYGPLDRVFVSPAMHQIHHSSLPEHRDKNMGFALSIWDGWFGTRFIAGERMEFPMGIGDGSDAKWHSVRSMYVRPFTELYQRILASKTRSH